MFTHRGIVIAFIVAGAALVGFLAARRSPADGAVSTGEAAPGSAPRPSTSEVRRLPRKVAPKEAELLDEIRQQIGSPLDRFMSGAAAGIEHGEREPPSGDTFRDIIAEEARRDRQSTVEPFGDGARARMPVEDPLDHYAAGLRNASRALDAAAADLEDAQAYDLADRLRQRAGALRLEARRPRHDTATD